MGPNILDPKILKGIKRSKSEKSKIKRSKSKKIKKPYKPKHTKIKSSRRDTFSKVNEISKRGMRTEISSENSARSILNNQVNIN